MRRVRILTVCGSGTVSSSMIANKLKDTLGEKGYKVETTEVNPGGVKSALSTGSYDFIAYTSPIHGEFDIPAINAVGFLTGFGEEEFIDEVLNLLEESE
ncbi:MAG: PTS sugar transporter subunit IIB [Tissierellia bacterium]|nr:PTS sugar transporter subunit IIB [Tissierellia bacterium]